MNTTNRVMVGVPMGEVIKPETVQTLLKLKDYPDVKDIVIQQGPYIHLNQNILVEKAKGFTHLFLVETDMSFSPKVLDQLLLDDKDIVGVPYNFKRFPLESMVKGAQDGELFKCDSIGTGCMLIKMSVFEKLNRPYFYYADEGMGEIGTDIYFCRRAKEAGFEIWGHKLEISHIGNISY